MQKTKKGFLGLIAMLIVVVAIVVWMLFMMRNNWLGGNGISESLNPNNTGTQAPQNSKEINAQLNDLRQDVKALQDKKDQEILDELNK